MYAEANLFNCKRNQIDSNSVLSEIIELYARENMVSEEALNAIEFLPVLEELDCEPGAERGSGFACTWKSTQSGNYPTFTELYSPLSFCKDLWDCYWGRAIKPLANLFALSPLTVPEVFAKVNSPQFRRDEYNFSFMFYVIYQA